MGKIVIVVLLGLLAYFWTEGLTKQEIFKEIGVISRQLVNQFNEGYNKP